MTTEIQARHCYLLYCIISWCVFLKCKNGCIITLRERIIRLGKYVIVGLGLELSQVINRRNCWLFLTCDFSYSSLIGFPPTGTNAHV